MAERKNSKRHEKASKSNKEVVRSKSAATIKKVGGIKTSEDFKQVFCALIEDILIGAVTPQIGNAMCNAGGRVIRVAELTLRYGNGRKKGPILRLVP